MLKNCLTFSSVLTRRCFNRRSVLRVNHYTLSNTCVGAGRKREDVTTKEHSLFIAPKNRLRPSNLQLKRLFFYSAVPMVGFGIMDQLVMISFGDLIDNTLGVRFGLATLTAAACGQIFSDVTGVCFGGLVQSVATNLGIKNPNLSQTQRNLKISQRIATAGAAFGVICGCLTGMLLLLAIDTTAKDKKMKKHDTEEIFISFLRTATKIIEAEYCAIHMIGPNENLITYKTNEDDKLSLRKEWVRMLLDKAIAAGAYDSPSNNSDTSSREKVITFPISSTANGRIIGLIELKFSSDQNELDSNRENLCKMLAKHVSIVAEKM